MNNNLVNEELQNILNEATELIRTPLQSEVTTTSQESSLSDEDIENILFDNGYRESVSEIPQETAQLSIQENVASETTSNEETSINSEISENAENNTEFSTPQEEENHLLPENSPTLLMDNTTSRFSGTEWFSKIQEARVILAGIGGIGSNTAFQLARMGLSMVLYDDDIVEDANISGQLFSFSDIEVAKVNAISMMIRDYCPRATVIGRVQQFDVSSECGDIMICGFDNMEARKTFFNCWKNYIQSRTEQQRNNCLFIDGRLSIDTLQVFCITGNDTYNINRYEKEFLFSDSEADTTICSLKQTTYMACMISSVIVNLFTNFIANTIDPIIPYSLPFFTEYNSQFMILKNEN